MTSPTDALIAALDAQREEELRKLIRNATEDANELARHAQQLNRELNLLLTKRRLAATAALNRSHLA